MSHLQEISVDEKRTVRKKLPARRAVFLDSQKAKPEIPRFNCSSHL